MSLHFMSHQPQEDINCLLVELVTQPSASRLYVWDPCYDEISWSENEIQPTVSACFGSMQSMLASILLLRYSDMLGMFIKYIFYLPYSLGVQEMWPMEAE